jgi:thiol-disulfide isomerase/thioredoxin
MMTGLSPCRAVGAFLIALAGLPAPAAGQHGAAAEELLRSIGMVRPAIASAPDFNLLDSHGRPVALSGFRGRWVLLNFWATWCEPCREEMPSMEQLGRHIGEGRLAILAVNQRENAAMVNRFVRSLGLNFTTALDTTGRVAGYYRVYGIPMSYLIDPDGQAIGVKSGPMDWSSSAVVNVFENLLGRTR